MLAKIFTAREYLGHVRPGEMTSVGLNLKGNGNRILHETCSRLHTNIALVNVARKFPVL
jgi:hypothetical protein